jgi:hypothetical protein
MRPVFGTRTVTVWERTRFGADRRLFGDYRKIDLLICSPSLTFLTDRNAKRTATTPLRAVEGIGRGEEPGERGGARWEREEDTDCFACAARSVGCQRKQKAALVVAAKLNGTSSKGFRLRGYASERTLT